MVLILIHFVYVLIISSNAMPRILSTQIAYALIFSSEIAMLIHLNAVMLTTLKLICIILL